jgi:hypothetical protein
MKPILFNTEMVQAILENRKSVTRRIIKLPEGMNGRPVGIEGNIIDNSIGLLYPGGIKRPPYKVGDILYVRETWLKADDGIYYKASIKVPSESEDIRKAYGYKWKPSIHMPKKAARIFLKVTAIRVERLQDITSEQAKNEGVDLTSGTPFPKTTARDCHGAKNGLSMYQSKFVILWDSTIKIQNIDKYGWEANPWVWVIEFERVEAK